MTVTMLVVGYLAFVVMWTEGSSGLYLWLVGDKLKHRCAFQDMWETTSSDMQYSLERRAILLLCWFFWPISLAAIILGAAIVLGIWGLASLLLSWDKKSSTQQQNAASKAT